MKQKNIPLIITAVFALFLAFILIGNIIAPATKKVTQQSYTRSSSSTTNNKPEKDIIQDTCDPLILDTEYKKIYFLSYNKLSQVIGTPPTVSDLKVATVWETSGLPEKYATKASENIRDNEMKSLLSRISENNALYLKVIIIDKPQVFKVEFGIGNANECNNTNNSNTSQVAIQQKNTADIKELEVQIDYYARNADIDLDYEIKNNGTIKASFHNERTGVYIQGNDAIALVDKIIEEVHFDKDSKETIMKKVLDILDADIENIEEFELEIKYVDGSKMKYEVQN